MLKAWAPAVTVWSCLVLLPFGRLVEVPVLAMAAAGIVLLVRRGRTLLAGSGFRIFSLVFLLAWIPILVSLPDAVNPQRTLVVGINHLRFYFAGVFMLHALGNPAAQERFLRLAAWLLGFWMLDALVQFAFGADVFGRGPSPLGLSGIFGPEGRHFAIFAALFTPLLFEHARRCWPGWLQLIVFAVTVFVIMSGGTRAAWVSLLCIIAAYVILFWIRRRNLPLKPLTLCLALALAATALGYRFSEPVRQRLDQSISELENPFRSGTLDHRAWIWRGGVNMFLSNPLNGVGARGFRYAYADYADAGDPYLTAEPPTHSHHMLMEVATETGLIGLAGLLALIGTLARAGWRAPPVAQRHMLPFGLALAAAYFPL
ncbi:MAG: O-antigen ligase family protein, partial [Gammaproteobacteria bacterium]|nr:O-antigen ligase family protein [Gammaproteobacteria bacterium]